jgi:hypothetical protein
MGPNYSIDEFIMSVDPVGVFQKFDCDSCYNVDNFYVPFVAAGRNVAAAGAVRACEDPDTWENFFLEESFFLGKIPHRQSAVFGSGHQKSSVGRKCHSGDRLFVGITKPVNLFVFWDIEDLDAPIPRRGCNGSIVRRKFYAENV